MAKSMTGFGRGEFNDGKRNIVVEIKSVNHRYCDIQVRMPRRYSFAEDAIKNTIKKYVNRGKFDVSMSVEYIAESDIRVDLNRPLVQQYIDNMNILRDEYGVNGDITLELISGMPEVLKQVSDVENEDEIRANIIKATEAAAANLVKMREAEGEKLAKDLVERADIIKDMVNDISVKAAALPGIYKEKLKARINDLLDGVAEISEERLAQEVALFAAKADITDEVHNRRKHRSRWKEAGLPRSRNEQRG